MKKNFVQHLENLPKEILSAPRFVETGYKGNPKAPYKGWNDPKNQKPLADIKKRPVGFIASRESDKLHVWYDFDHCLTKDGGFINGTAQAWYQQLHPAGTYAELSQGKDGVHIFAELTAELPLPEKTKLYLTKDKTSFIEIFYQTNKNCCVTGDCFNCEPNAPIVKGELADICYNAICATIANQNRNETKTQQTHADKSPTIDKSHTLPQTDCDYDIFRANIMLDYINPTELTEDGKWLAVISACKNIGIDYSVVDTFNRRDPERYDEKENKTRWDSVKDPSFDIGVLHGIAKNFGYDEKTTKRKWFELHPELSTRMTFAAMDDDEYDDDPTAPRTQDRLPDCPINLRVPAGFTFSNRGIWYEMPARKQGAEPKLIKVANTPIIPTKAFREHGNGITSYEVAIKKKGKWWRATVDGRTLQDPRKVLDLANDSASILEPRLLARFFADTLVDINLPETTVYNQPGWHGDQFIDPCGGDGYRVCRAGFDYQREFETKGDPELLKKYFIDACNFGGAVARIFSGTSLAAPLIRRLNAPNAQIQLNSTSGGGKTALNKINAAIFGNPLELIRTFAATEKNRQAVAAAYNDLPSFFDEMETMTGKRAEEQLSQMIYSYSEGKGNQANKRNGEARQAFRFYGSRLMTAERPILKENDPLGAYKRLNQFRPTKLFDDDFAGELHIIAENNYGHFRRTWTNFIAEHIDEIKFIYQSFNKFFIGAHRELNPTQVKGITLAAIALQFFLVAIGAQETFNDQAAEQDINSAISMLPTAAELSDTHRAIKELNSYVASHEKSFIRPVKDIDTGNIIEIGTSTPVCLGKIFDTGEVAFFPTELRKILVDELKFTNADKLISEWNDQGDILITKENRTTDVIKIDKKTYRVIHFKANIITSDIDSAETTYYEERGLL